MSKKRKKGMCFEDRPITQPCAAGIDIGAREIFVAVHHDPDHQPVRRFGTFTEDLQQRKGHGCVPPDRGGTH